MTRLNYQLSSDASDNPYVLLIHGLFGSLDNLAMLRRELQNNYNVLSIDLPDHGKSYRSDQFSYSQIVRSITALLDELNIAKTAIVGHSLGGKVAMYLALQSPERVRQLVVADIAPVKYGAGHNNVFAGLNNVALHNLDGRSAAQKQLAIHIQETGVQQFLLKSLYQEESKWQWRFNLSLLERDYEQLSAGIESSSCYSGPCLFIKGEMSDYIKTEHQAHIQSLFPNASAKIIQGTGHWLHAEKPVAFNRIVSNFLSQDIHPDD